ncbi:MAG: hypothetical protein HUK25_05560 [Treponema sp.]|nr:hypothetical protein [Treponema sp.]
MNKQDCSESQKKVRYSMVILSEDGYSHVSVIQSLSTSGELHLSVD